MNPGVLEGSAWIRNLADDERLFRRIRDSDRKKAPSLEGIDALVYVDKNRYSGDEGILMLSFDHDTRLFGHPRRSEGE